jgi:hypothetical protein
MSELYYSANRLVYAVDDFGAHLVPDIRWSEYLAKRQTVPKVVRCYAKAQEVYDELSGDKDQAIEQSKVQRPAIAWWPVTREHHEYLLVDERWTGKELI